MEIAPCDSLESEIRPTDTVRVVIAAIYQRVIQQEAGMLVVGYNVCDVAIEFMVRPLYFSANTATDESSGSFSASNAANSGLLAVVMTPSLSGCCWDSCCCDSFDVVSFFRTVNVTLPSWWIASP